MRKLTILLTIVLTTVVFLSCERIDAGHESKSLRF